MAKKQLPGANISPKRKLFAECYADCMNGKQAAIMAGYSEKSAEALASKLVHTPEIREYIDYLTRTMFDKLGITREWIALELKSIATNDARNYLTSKGQLKPLHELTQEQGRNIQEMQFDSKTGVLKTVKLYSRHVALQDLKRMAGYDEPVGAGTPSARVNIKKAERNQTGKESLEVIDIELDF